MGCLDRTGAVALATALVLTMSLGHAGAEDAPGVSKDTVKIGSWMSLTGPVAVYGVPLEAGAKAYFDTVNAAGGVNGRKIDWIVEDNAYNPQQTVAIARKLITRDNILAAVIPHGTAQTAATFPFAVQQHKLPILLPYGQAVEWFQPNPMPGVLGLHVTYESQVEAIGRWAAQDGHKNILALYGAHAAFEKVTKYAEPGAKAVSGDAKVEMVPVKMGTTDYAPIAVDAIRKAPDAIVAVLQLQEIALLAKSLRQQGSQIPIYSYAPTVANATIELGGESVEGLKAVSLTISPLAVAPAAKEYRESLAKYAPNQKPDFVSFLGYGAAKIFTEALSHAKEPLTRESLLDGFYTLKDYDSGVFPPVTFSAERTLGGYFLNPMIVKDGAWVAAGDVIDTRTFQN